MMDEVEHHKRLMFEGEEWQRTVFWDHEEGFVYLNERGDSEGWWFSHWPKVETQGGPYQTAGAAMRAMVKELRGGG